MSEARVNLHSTDYNRPQDEWVCGRAYDGIPCPLGPSGHGVCRVEKQCRPAMHNGTWVCTRGEDQGGPCQDGPSSQGICSSTAEECRPFRSLRIRRGAWALGLATFMLGLLILNLGGPWQNDVLAPGPLSKAHGQILEGTRRCEACHPAASSSFSTWLTATVKNGNPFASTQTERCLECHAKTMVAQMATMAHTSDAERIRQITAEQLEQNAGTASDETQARAIPAHLHANIACNTCHREHHGNKNLSALTSQQCQVCHQNQFPSFNKGHPGFGEWPYSSDRGISFDHAHHLGKYFTQAKKDISCSQCHINKNGIVSAVTSYEKICATCHDDFMNQIDSLAVLTLPMIDPDVFAEANLTVGDWPVEAIGDFDGRLPIFARVLLLADERAHGAIERLGGNFDYFDVSVEDEQRMQDAAQVAWSLKKLVYELSADGQVAIQNRLETILQRELTTLELQSIAGQLPPAVFRTAQERWFPNLEQEIKQRVTGAQPIPTDSTDLGGKEMVAFGGWYVDSEVCSIGYRPIGHNDELVRSWIELMAELQNKVSGSHDWEAEFGQLSLTKQCANCHVSSDKRQWLATSASAPARGFTHFDHEPHLVLPQLAECTACHGIGWQAPHSTTDVTAKESHVPEFTAMDKASCAQCHTANGAGNDCTTCHNYHVDFGSSPATTPPGRMDVINTAR